MAADIKSDAKQNEHRGTLPAGTRLRNYELISVLGHGGFGITYFARDTTLGRDVAVKEYLPTSLALREDGTMVVPRSTQLAEDFIWGRERFLEEARILATLEGAPAVVRVYDFLEANGTAYMVMGLARGDTLEQRLKRDGKLPPAVAEHMLERLLDGLEAVHNTGFLHRDVKPANVILDSHDSPTLIDFGASRASMADRTSALTAIFTPRYAAAEQLTSDKQGPWTDIYGVSATLYHAIVGKAPPSSLERALNDNYEPLTTLSPPGYRAATLRAIDAGLAVRAKDRPQTIAAWREVLTGSDAGSDATVYTRSRPAAPKPPASVPPPIRRQPPAPVAVAPPVAPPPSPADRPAVTGRKPALLYGGAALLVLVLLAGGGYFAFAPRPVPAPVQGASVDSAAQARAEAEARQKEAEEARLREEAEARQKAEAEAQQKAAAEAQQKAAAEAQQRLEAEARQRAEEDARQRAAAEAQQRALAEAQAKAKAEEEARQRAAAEARQRTEAEARQKALAEAQAKAAAEARARAEAEAKAKADAEAKAKAEEEARQRAAAEAQARAAAEAKAKADAEARQKAETEARQKALAEAQAKAAAEAKAKAEAEAKAKADEEARQRAAAEAQARAAAEAKAKADAEARQKADAEARQRSMAEAQAKAADDAKAKAEGEAKLKAEEEARQRAAAAEAQARAAAEAKAKADAEARQKAEAEAQQVAAADAKAKAEADAADQKAAEAGETALKLSLNDRQHLQVALTSLGFDTHGIDGVFGPRTREMITGWQRARNQPTTGFLTASQQQALLSEAKPAIAKYDDDQRKAAEAAARARAVATPAPAAQAPAPVYRQRSWDGGASCQDSSGRRIDFPGASSCPYGLAPAR